MKFLCRIGLHRWTRWETRAHRSNGMDTFVIQRRECACGKFQMREIPA